MKQKAEGDRPAGLAELSLLFDISTKLSDTLDLKTALKPILRMTAGYMKIPRGTLTILNRNRGKIAIEEAYGLRPEEQAQGKYNIGEGITGKVIDTGKAIIVPRISEEPLFLDRTGSRKHLDKSDIAFICVPVKVGSETVGALSADRPSRGEHALEADIRLLTIIASTISQAVRLRQLAHEEMEKVMVENRRLQDQLKVRYRPKAIVGNSKIMRDVYDLIETVGGKNTTVLILGESGVGKERVAHAVHYGSPRAEKPFVKVNCAALPESLIESELFGHEKGAYTGATLARKGRFEMAERGTIFLDEIGELSLSVQTKLLRIIQEKEFERIGGNATLKSDVRIIAATNRDLAAAIREGIFREDLYYRLNIFPILVPPLRERRTDIMLLAEHFLQKYAREHGKKIDGIATSATDKLMNYHWPGNVRELENCIERAVILCADGKIRSHHLPPSLQMADAAGRDLPGTFKGTMAGVEQEIIVDELKRCRGNVAGAARALGITERMIGLRIAKYGIEPKKFK
jgi:Nif-specific regulatory protein